MEHIISPITSFKLYGPQRNRPYVCLCQGGRIEINRHIDQGIPRGLIDIKLIFNQATTDQLIDFDTLLETDWRIKALCLPDGRNDPEIIDLGNCYFSYSSLGISKQHVVMHQGTSIRCQHAKVISENY